MLLHDLHLSTIWTIDYDAKTFILMSVIHTQRAPTVTHNSHAQAGARRDDDQTKSSQRSRKILTRQSSRLKIMAKIPLIKKLPSVGVQNGLPPNQLQLQQLPDGPSRPRRRSRRFSRAALQNHKITEYFMVLSRGRENLSNAPIQIVNKSAIQSRVVQDKQPNHPSQKSKSSAQADIEVITIDWYI